MHRASPMSIIHQKTEEKKNKRSKNSMVGGNRTSSKILSLHSMLFSYLAFTEHVWTVKSRTSSYNKQQPVRVKWTHTLPPEIERLFPENSSQKYQASKTEEGQVVTRFDKIPN